MRSHLATFLFRGLAVAALGTVVSPSAGAQPFSREDLPPSLRPWVPWVLDEVPTLGCATVQGQPVCVWPGQLHLDLGPAGGTFGLDLAADRSADVRLPGTVEHWPQDVRLDGSPAPVFERDGTPRLRVDAGRHRLAGRFAWSRLPESLSVPAEIGLVDLRIDGQAVPRPRRDQAGLLWLRAGAESVGEGESLRLQAFRRVRDGIPLFVETRLELEVAGRAREVTFPGALLRGTVPVAVSGDLPARVEKDALRVQVRGGRYSVRVDARVDGRPTAIGLPREPAAEPWPPREVWVFAADESQRQVELSGLSPIDSSRTELPREWRALPAFLVEPGASLAFKEVRRGEAEPPPDTLTLTRELWLDPDGRQASVRDHFAGTLRATTRLDLLPPGTLGRIAVGDQDQLVTAHPETKAPGVELRRSELQLEADSRVPVRGSIPAVGWSTGVEQLQATLNVPPGWSVLGARGVDRLPDTWTSRWNLLGFFFVLIISLSVYRLLGRWPGLLALGALVLLQGEAGAPYIVWLSLVAAIALQPVAPAGRVRQLARLWFLASAAVLVVIVVPFARDQVKAALYPQVGDEEAGRGGRLDVAPAKASRPRGGIVGGVPAAAPVQMQAPEEKLEGQLAKRKSDRAALSEEEVPQRRQYTYNVALEQDPKAVLQTGPGVPSWSWRTYSLTWSGPVGRDHTMRLFLLSPGMNRLLTVLRLALLAALGYLLLAGRWPALPRRPRTEAAIAPTTPALLVVFLLSGLFATVARAEQDAMQEAPGPATPTTPGQGILQELRQRLTRPASCEPRCVTTPNLVLRLGDSRLDLAAEVHAAADGTWPIPGPVGSWTPSEVRLDGAPAGALARLADGFLRLRLPRGVHRVEAGGPVPPGDSFTLQFGDPPRRARAEAPGWDVSGLRADGPAEPSILLTRRLVARTGATAEGRYAPWLEVTRTLAFGVTWTVETRVRRVTPVGAPVAVRVPLLPGEAPTRANLVVEKGEVAVSLGGDDTEAQWQSTLEQSPKVVLRAPEGRPWSEVWRLQCSPIWSCSADGLPPVSRVAEGGVFVPEYRPWPGESATVTLAHPQGVEGQTLTIDGVTLEATPGRRLERARLVATARSSREQPLVLGIPKAAEVQQVMVDGQDRPSRPEQGELRLTVPAGRHTVEVRWQQPRGMGAFYGVPRVSLSAPAVNVTQVLTVPPERWLLATRGPAWGPAVLFWPYLVFLLVVAVALGRLPRSPLTSGQWVLLGLGVSVLPALAALVVAAFVLALAERARRHPQGTWAFDLVQVVLAAWALVSLALLYVAIHQGLLFRPDMQVAGGGSTDTELRWYSDRVAGAMPAAGVLSLPLWLYRVAMLLWALWLAASLVRAVAPAWRAFSAGGVWRPILKRAHHTEPPGSVESDGDTATPAS